MFLFAHVGITVGVALAAQVSRLGRQVEPAYSLGSSVGSSADRGADLGGRHCFRRWASRKWRQCPNPQLDYRLIAVGSVLPDVDKFIGLALFQDFDRSFFHTLAFFLALLILGAFLSRRNADSRGLQAAYCCGMHLVLDQMWLRPGTLLWPVSGWNPTQGKLPIPEFGDQMVRSLTTDWGQIVPEVVGLAVLLWLALGLVRRGAVAKFLQMGRIASVAPDPKQQVASKTR